MYTGCPRTFVTWAFFLKSATASGYTKFREFQNPSPQGEAALEGVLRSSVRSTLLSGARCCSDYKRDKSASRIFQAPSMYFYFLLRIWKEFGSFVEKTGLERTEESARGERFTNPLALAAAHATRLPHSL